MLINKMKGVPILYKSHKDFLETIKPFVGKYWEKHPTWGTFPKIKAIQNHIRSALKDLQENECAFCGLPFDETSNEEIEHIAPKGVKADRRTPLYPEFMFTPLNLVLSCRLCNSPKRKGRFDTIETYDLVYDNCTFKIVHPYFDDPDEHYEFTISFAEVLIQNKSDRGRSSIDLFDLAGTAKTEARAKKNNQAVYKALPQDKKDLIEQIMGYTKKME